MTKKEIALHKSLVFTKKDKKDKKDTETCARDQERHTRDQETGTRDKRTAISLQTKETYRTDLQKRPTDQHKGPRDQEKRLAHSDLFVDKRDLQKRPTKETCAMRFIFPGRSVALFDSAISLQSLGVTNTCSICYDRADDSSIHRGTYHILESTQSTN